MIGPVDAVAAEPGLPDGVVIREVFERDDIERIAQLEETVWDEDHSWIDALAEERAPTRKGCGCSSPRQATSPSARAGCGFPSGTEFATFWGGATLPDWRGRGIYRALVAHRARLAAERGCRYIEVDASDDSRPILERLGFVAVTTTTPYVWSPPVVG